MLIVCLVIQIAGVLLAILSRIHFSKYKAAEEGQQASLPEKVTGLLYERICTSKVVDVCRKKLRKLYVLSPEQEEILVRKKVTQVLFYVLVIPVVSASLAEMFMWNHYRNTEHGELVITRNDYTGWVKSLEVCLSDDNQFYEYSMDIYPREYTEEEFYTLAQEQIREVREKILLDNYDENHITGDLYLPTEDETGIFAYQWISDNPQLISSDGVVHTEDITDTAAVTLTLLVSYLSYKEEEQIPLTVVKDSCGEETALTNTLQALQQLEQQTRTNENVILPKEYDGMRIALADHSMEQAKRCLVVGLILIFLVFVISKMQVEHALRVRNHLLKKQYPAFVNSLWMLLGSGMTIRTGIRYLVSGMKDNVLKKELEYALHQLENGVEEAWAYEQLGRRLAVPEYYRLMQHLGQHIRKGTKDLRNLMETEAQAALRIRHEFAKKQGEEASTKLLFPMVILLAAVMLVIVYPAMSGF